MSVAVALRPASATIPIPAQVVGYGLFLFFLCMLCHGELVGLRPGRRRLTLFYLLIATGGGLGGAFVSLVAPFCFSGVWELYIAVLVAWLVVAVAWYLNRNSPLWAGDPLFFALAVALAAPIAVPLLIVATPLRRTSWVVHHPWTAVFVGGAALALGAYLLGRRWGAARISFWPRAVFVVMIGLAANVLFRRMGEARADTVYAGRNFYGLVRVIAVKDQLSGEVGAYKLVHGLTNHGIQFTDPASRDLPTTYYAPSSGVGVAARYLESPSSPVSGPLHLGVLGLGVGTLATYARPGERVRFYEIDPIVIALAGRDSPYFSFLRDCAGAVDVVAGDARLSLEREAAREPGTYDLLALDAFSGDGIPVHLLTVEAFRLYASRLRGPHPILAVHITNAYLDLEPVVAADAQALGWAAIRIDTAGADSPLPESSSWILLTPDPMLFQAAAFQGEGSRPLRARKIVFTDQYTNLFRVLR
jgi:hypothetical protein